MGRFINADAYLNANCNIMGYNLFAYCSNNPIAFYDPNGESTIFVLATVVLSLMFLMSGCSSDIQTNSNSNSINDLSWMDDDPLFNAGRYKTLDDAVEHVAIDMKMYANEIDKEVGCYIYEFQGGYYVQAINQVCGPLPHQ